MSQANIVIEAYCLLITIILQICNFVMNGKTAHSKRLNILRAMLFINAIVIISFILTVLNEGHPELAVWNNIVTGICYAGGTLMSEVFGEYVFAIVEEKQKVSIVLKNGFRFICAFLIALDIISIFNGMYFATVNGLHVRGPYYMVNQIFVLCIMLMELLYTLGMIRVIGRQASALAMYVVVPAISVILQIYIQDYILMYPAVTLSMLIIYVVSYITNTEELHKKNDELVKAIEETEQAKKLTEKANQAKSEFLSSMSHDIRTPLNAIVGMTDMAIENLDDKKAAYENLKVVRDSSKHLLYLVNDVLDLSMIESGKIHLTESEFFLADIITELETMIWPLIKAKKQTFVFDCDNDVDEAYVGDHQRIKQVLMNFLSNAIKYTQAGGSITLKAYEEKGFDTEVNLRFDCIDNGIGIDKKAQEHIFEPFVREVKSTINPVEGTGLGLAIVRNIVDAMHGELSVKSEKGMGSTFSVSFPLHRTDEKKMLEKFADVSAYYILVIADTEELCEIVRKNYHEMTSADCDVVPSDVILKGDFAVKDYDVIICISVENAVEVTRVLRKSYPEISIIFGGNMSMMNQERQILDAGADAVLYRPVFKSTLFEEFQRLKHKSNSVAEEKKYLFGKNILVAEDNEINYQIIEHILQNAGAIVWHAEDGMHAVDLFMGARVGRFDAVLMDIMMPVMDGYTATEKIRNAGRPDSKSIPIIAMTANAFAEDIQRSKDYGMNAHISKPLSPEMVKDVLMNCIK